MASQKNRRIVVNTLGTLGYFSVILQVAWTIIILGYPLITANSNPLFPAPSSRTAPQLPEISGIFSPIITVITIIFVALILLTTIVVIVRLPKTIGQSGARTTHSVAKVILPVVTHQKPLPKKQVVLLSYRLIVMIKYGLILLPLILLLFAPQLSGLTREAIIITGFFCAGFSFIYFTLQLVFVELLRIDKKNVW